MWEMISQRGQNLVRTLVKVKNIINFHMNDPSSFYAFAE